MAFDVSSLALPAYPPIPIFYSKKTGHAREFRRVPPSHPPVDTFGSIVPPIGGEDDVKKNGSGPGTLTVLYAQYNVTGTTCTLRFLHLWEPPHTHIHPHPRRRRRRAHRTVPGCENFEGMSKI